MLLIHVLLIIFAELVFYLILTNFAEAVFYFIKKNNIFNYISNYLSFCFILTDEEQAELFTGVLPNVYWPPRGFCFDTFCSDEELTVSRYLIYCS